MNGAPDVNEYSKHMNQWDTWINMPKCQRILLKEKETVVEEKTSPGGNFIFTLPFFKGFENWKQKDMIHY